MLILSRNPDQSIVITDDKNPEFKATVTVLSVRGKCVRLGLDAPMSVVVHREEIHKQIQDARAAMEPAT